MPYSALRVAVFLSATVGVCEATDANDIDNYDTVQGSLLQAQIEETGGLHSFYSSDDADAKTDQDEFTKVKAMIQETRSSANPIRKVVTMLQHIQSKIEAEEERDKELYRNFMCYCKTSGEEWSDSIEAAEVKIPQLEAAILQAAEKQQLEEDIKQAKADRAEAQKLLADLEKTCKTVEAEWVEMKSMRAQELAALADTIKVLNDDDSVELFKKTLPSAGSMQVQVSERNMRQQALDALQHSRGDRLGFIALALADRKVGFDKVIGMIDELVETLKQEQKDDDNKKTYCNAQFDSSDDKTKSLEWSLADQKTGITTAKSEIEALTAGIRALDKRVAEATERRKEEKAEFQQLMANDAAAKELLGFAKNRLNKFYNPTLYVAPPKQLSLSEEDRITVNMGGTLTPKSALRDIACAGSKALIQVGKADPQLPPGFKAYSKSSKEYNGVIARIDILIKDLDKEMTEAQAQEKDAQADYLKAMSDSAEQRKADSKSLAVKKDELANMQAALEKHTDEKNSTKKELAATLQDIHSLHGDCDWLLKNFDARAGARANEVDSLLRAKAVLSGAD